MGNERAGTERQVPLRSGEQLKVEVEAPRWIDMPADDWYGADGHLHITRMTPTDDEAIGKMMRAEDLHVANLLQMGTQKQFGVTPQHGFGEAAVHREGATLLISGQEHPRSHVWGHTVILGANLPLDLRDTYVLNQRFWRVARREGGLAGYAHHGLGNARDGLLVDGPTGLISFLEVLQFELPYYDVWYDLLNLGVELTPTAGTDFPCGFYGLPGRERFYTRVDGELTRESWLAGIEAGRTFVTNGPMLHFDIDGTGIGGTRTLDAPGSVMIAGRVDFDPQRDIIDRLELVHNGEPRAVEADQGAGRLSFRLERQIHQTSWFALRVSGRKIGEQPFAAESRWERFFFEEVDARVSDGCSTTEIREFRAAQRQRPSAAHTAAIYVEVADSPGLAEQPRARALAHRALERLDSLDDRLGEVHLTQQILRNLTYTDGIPAAEIRDNRPALDRAIGSARAHYRTIVDQP